MSFTLKAENLGALLISTSDYKKESAFTENLEAKNNVESLKALLADAYILGLPQEKLLTVSDEADNTKLLEKLADLSGNCGDAFLFYYSGDLIVRKNKLFLAGPKSTVAQAHINALSLENIIEVLEESTAKQLYFIFDVSYHSYHSDEDIHSVLEDRFKFYNTEGKRKLFLCSNTSSGSSFTSDFSKVLSKGDLKPKEYLSFLDTADLLINHLKSYNELTPFSFGETESDYPFIPNTRYQKYLRNKREADLYFESESYQAALPFYQMAQELYSDPDNLKKIQFIELIQNADDALRVEDLHSSKTYFKEATALFPSSYATGGVKNVLTKIGDLEFNTGNFEDAKNAYLELERIENTDTVRSKVELCEKEIKFSNFNDEADQAYFNNDFHKAHLLYDKALQLKHSLQLVRRKEECDRFIKQEVNIREKVEEEIKAQYENELRQTSSKDSLVSEIKDELKSDIEREFNSKIDHELWRRVAIMNDLSAYQLYLGIFPNGIHVEKANKRIAEIHEIEKSKQAPKKPAPIPQEDSSGIPVDLLLKLRTDDIEDILGEINATPLQVSEDNVETENEVETAEIPQKEEEISEEENAQKPEKKVIVVEPKATKRKEIPKEEQRIVVVKPNSSEELQQLDEASLWNFAEQEGTIESYMAYVNHTKASLHLADAYYMINKLNLDDLQSDNTPVFTEENTEVVVKEETEAPLNEVETVEDNSTIVEEEPNQNNEATIENIVESAVIEDEENQITVGLIENDEMVGLSESELWQKATEDDTIASYKTYLSFTEESDHIADAYARISELKSGEPSTPTVSSTETQEVTVEQKAEVVQEIVEEKTEPEVVVEEKAPAKENESSILSTLKAKPEALPKVDEEDIWKTAQSTDTLSAYFNYLNSTLEKKYWAEAKERIHQLKNDSMLKEIQDWEDTENEDTLEAYKAYIQKYPLGNYYAKAMFRIDKLS
ncbi:ring-infected erythrocyte surface antigen domain-containing protein [Sediminitomix flava]|uniref:Tetratricopeptide repeat protein n=1 Tax=Sediminitomix flava TaxID=379075 RepID=A0A315ZV16_SEDFL|nr:caspase family protein [Sediminitomix flava]PWJ40019.1 hypothetical protein BC781_10582 [Sediminitomix flava]